MIAAAFFFPPGFLALRPSDSGGCVHWHRAAAGFFPWIVWSGAGAAAAAVGRPAGKMMEEISIMVAYDAHVFSQLHDEDFLTGLVAISKPRPMVGDALLPALGMVFLFCHDSSTPTAIEADRASWELK